MFESLLREQVLYPIDPPYDGIRRACGGQPRCIAEHVKAMSKPALSEYAITSVLAVIIQFAKVETDQQSLSLHSPRITIPRSVGLQPSTRNFVRNLFQRSASKRIEFASVHRIRRNAALPVVR